MTILKNKINTDYPSELKIIDVHTHIGEWFGYYCDIKNLNYFLENTLEINADGKTEKYSIEKMLVSNLNCIFNNGTKDEYEGNREILEISKKYKKLYPLMVCQPLKTNGNPIKIEQLLKKYKNMFYGLKFHPQELPLRADDNRYDKYIELAQKENLPSLFHCQDGNSSPENIYKLAKKHKDARIILGHLGAGSRKNHIRAINVLIESVKNNDAKLFADISWVDWCESGLTREAPDIIDAIKKLKDYNAQDRLLFGTDAPLGCFGTNSNKEYETMIYNLKTSIEKNFPSEAPKIIRDIFYNNANKLFFKKN